MDDPGTTLLANLDLAELHNKVLPALQDYQLGPHRRLVHTINPALRVGPTPLATGPPGVLTLATCSCGPLR